MDIIMIRTLIFAKLAILSVALVLDLLQKNALFVQPIFLNKERLHASMFVVKVTMLISPIFFAYVNF
jgi:hypothetical protein